MPNSQVLDWYASLRDRVRRLAEIEGLTAEDRQRLADDVGIDPAELPQLAIAGTRASALMIEMMRGKGVDEDALRADLPDVFRSAAVACSVCAERDRCSHEMQAGTAVEHADDFCANSALFDELSVMADVGRH